MATRGKLYTSLYYLDDLPDYFYGTLAPSTGCLPVFDLIPYKDGMLLVLPERTQPGQILQVIPQDKLYQIFSENKQWGKILEVNDMGQLNKIVEEKFSGPMIKISEALHEKKISQIADKIKARQKKSRLSSLQVPLLPEKPHSGKGLPFN